ncbi:hypothetical protein [Metabacillus malikii]|uniref:Uncharacterized protein n=1 Tax=Metabacillus malikii TaxID=1504265 RepID=A0ABT9ZCJ6_9BACI|nr:hypothetical protein [Metabacillus malikii]MDQ0229977.1 hypothetical protein [Metabacillus malikii]
MLTRIKKVKLDTEGKNPNYRVVLESPDGKQLYIHFDYTIKTKTFWPLEVHFDGKKKGARLAWYTSDIEKMTVAKFLELIAKRINKKYGFVLES